MNQWPDGWTDSSGDRHGRGSRAPQPDPTRPMPHVPQGTPPGVPPQSRGEGPGYGREPGYGAGPGPGPGPYDSGHSGYNQGQVYRGAGGGGAGDGYGDDPYGRGRPNWGRRIKWGVLTLVLVLVAWSVGTYFWADSKLRNEVDLSIVQDRPESGEGTNYLIVGSDSREGMSKQEQQDLRTGSVEGKRTDSMMILHVGDNGNTMVSLPRDSWVRVPSYTGSDSGKDYPDKGRATKLNATYSEDGPTLLVRAVEHNTGVKIDHYAEIGFGGFAKIVDALGGVEMDIPKDIKDEKSGADLQKGKQTLDGKDALAFVRTRYALGSDLDRTKNQQKFLSALADQAATPTSILNPFTLYPTMGAGLDSLIVDEEMGLFDVASMFWAMKGISGGDGKSMNMPVLNQPGPQGSLQWDKAKVKKLADQLNNDEKVTVTSDR